MGISYLKLIHDGENKFSITLNIKSALSLPVLEMKVVSHYIIFLALLWFSLFLFLWNKYQGTLFSK